MRELNDPFLFNIYIKQPKLFQKTNPDSPPRHPKTLSTKTNRLLLLRTTNNPQPKPKPNDEAAIMGDPRGNYWPSLAAVGLPGLRSNKK
jgi:hypothetical protein